MKLEKIIKFSNKGFSLVEIMVTVGLIGVLAYLVINASGVTKDATKDSDDFAVTNEWTNAITNIFLRRESCAASFVTPGLKANDGVVVNGLVNYATGASVATINQAKGGVSIVNMVLAKRWDDISNQLSYLTLKVTYQKSKRKLSESFNFKARIDASRNILECFSDFSAISTKIQICSSLGGTYATATNLCTMLTAGVTLKVDMTSINTLITSMQDRASQINPDVCILENEMNLRLGSSVQSSFCSIISKGSAKTTAECSAAGGVTRLTADGNLCFFSGTVCRSGWVQHKNWSTTSAVTCTLGCSLGSVTTGAHAAAANLAPEYIGVQSCETSANSTYCGTEANGDAKTCPHLTDTFLSPCVANITSVGCI